MATLQGHHFTRSGSFPVTNHSGSCLHPECGTLRSISCCLSRIFLHSLVISIWCQVVFWQFEWREQDRLLRNHPLGVLCHAERRHYAATQASLRADRNGPQPCAFYSEGKEGLRLDVRRNTCWGPKTVMPRPEFSDLNLIGRSVGWASGFSEAPR